MKSIVRNFVFVLVCFIAPVVGFGQSFPYVKLQEKENNVVVVRISKSHKSEIALAINTDLGGKIYSESIKAEQGYLKSFDLRNLNDGDYVITVENNQSIQKFPFTVNESKLELNTEHRLTSYKPQVRVNNKNIDLNILNLEHDFTSMLITDDKGAVVYKDHLGTDLELKKRYNLSKLNNGVYHIVVSKGNRSFDHEIALN